jgi:hypothetical protein
LLALAVLWRPRAAGVTALLEIGLRARVRQHTQGSDEDFPSRHLPNLVGEVNGLIDLRITEAGLSSFRDMVFDAGHAVAAQSGAERHELPFCRAELVHDYISFVRVLVFALEVREAGFLIWLDGSLECGDTGKREYHSGLDAPSPDATVLDA